MLNPSYLDYVQQRELITDFSDQFAIRKTIKHGNGLSLFAG